MATSLFEGRQDLRRLILRRLVENLRAQQWLAVLIDLGIVILGVFIGIEVANWNERRNDRHEERRYYQQIIGNLDTDLATIATAHERSIGNDVAADFVLAGLENDGLVRRQPGRFAMSMLRAGFLYIPRPSRQTYDELISTGNLRLLRDPEVKAALSRYYTLFEEVRQWDPMVRDQQGAYWSESAGVLPRHALQTTMRLKEPKLTEEEVTQALARARARPRLRDMLVAMAAHQEWVRRDCDRFTAETRKLQGMLKQRLAEMD